MQNNKFKTSLVAIASAIVSLSATTKVMAQNTTPPVKSTSEVLNEESVLSVESTRNSSNLEQITQLKFEKAMLELKKDIAKLRTDINEIETGKKSDKSGKTMISPTPPSMVTSDFGTQQPTSERSLKQILFDSVRLISIYGSDDKLTAEFESIHGRTIGRVGVILPTDETVTVIKPDYVIVSKGKKSRRLNLSTGIDMINMMNLKQQENNTRPNGMPMIYPFEPSNLFSETNNTPKNAPFLDKKDDDTDMKHKGL